MQTSKLFVSNIWFWKKAGWKWNWIALNARNKSDIDYVSGRHIQKDVFVMPSFKKERPPRGGIEPFKKKVLNVSRRRRRPTHKKKVNFQWHRQLNTENRGAEGRSECDEYLLAQAATCSAVKSRDIWNQSNKFNDIFSFPLCIASADVYISLPPYTHLSNLPYSQSIHLLLDC